MKSLLTRYLQDFPCLQTPGFNVGYLLSLIELTAGQSLSLVVVLTHIVKSST